MCHLKIEILILVLLCLLSPAFGYLTITPWQPKFKGIEHARGETDQPRLQKVNAIRVDLQDPNIRFMVTPSNGAALGGTTRQTGSSFIAQYGVQVAINGQYIDVSTGAPAYPYADLYGLSINNGQIVSPLADLHTLLGVNPGTLLLTQNNVARIQTTLPSTDLTRVWTAIESWAYLLVNGENTGDPRYIAGDIEPRSAAGLSQDGRYLILMTIDGRQSGYSEGATSYEESEWLQRFGAFNGINLDGGGSKPLWISEYNGSTYALNSPSENRAVGNHIGIYAASLNTVSIPETFTYADFENGNESTFNVSPGYSGSTYGINKTLSTAEVVYDTYYHGLGCQRLSIIDDVSQSGGWFVRHNSGASASRSGNIIRPTLGYIGLWAKTSVSGCKISVAIDNIANITADRGKFKAMSSDGLWHLYKWNLKNNGDWEAWVNGDGIIDTEDFTIDSIQFTNSADVDATIYIDEVSHSTSSAWHICLR